MRPIWLWILFTTILGCRGPAPAAAEHTYAAPSPASPASWAVPAWYIDPSSTVVGPIADGGTGPCASDDLNNCQSATCGSVGSGIGPCLTFRKIQARLGCTNAPGACPRLRQNVSINVMSPQVDATDTWYLRAALENAANLSIVGTPTVVCSGTLSGVVSRNRGSQSLPQASLCAQATQDELVVDTTRGGAAWTYALVSGTTWRLSEPVGLQVVPFNCVDQNEQDTWANGDAYQVLSLPTAYIADVELAALTMPVVPDGGQTCGGITISRVSVPRQGQYQSVILGGGVRTQESFIGPTTAVDGHTIFMDEQEQNCDLNAVSSQTGNSQPPFVKGGIFREIFASNIVKPYVATGLGVESSAILANGQLVITSGQLNDVYIESGAEIDVEGLVLSDTIPTVWGPGIFNIAAPGNLFFSGTGASHLASGTLEMNFLSTACALSDAGAVLCGRPFTAAAFDVAVADGGFGSAPFSPAGASITTNSSPF